MMDKNIVFDRFDLKILEILQEEGAIANQELAERVGLTAAPCSRRVKQLEEAGVISRRTARLNERYINLHLTVILLVSMDKHVSERFAVFEQAIREIPEVVECYLVAGNHSDYQLKVLVPNMERYHELLLGRITRIPGVSGVQSSFVLNKIVDTTALPLRYANVE
ncbi:Lrp/AsnC family transcriptional regulator [Thiofilum flexile]|uniref:Lrp/AsnC family transcriptional regulator n=1 Tax=Thiofilum flexile TaxID=125627 RepID=UPI0003998C46|nr:Lrp/AsnC family transcriptional regulator [Thiofilum flexile]